jgi:hypothetical protein
MLPSKTRFVGLEKCVQQESKIYEFCQELLNSRMKNNLKTVNL